MRSVHSGIRVRPGHRCDTSMLAMSAYKSLGKLMSQWKLPVLPGYISCEGDTR